MEIDNSKNNITRNEFKQFEEKMALQTEYQLQDIQELKEQIKLLEKCVDEQKIEIIEMKRDIKTLLKKYEEERAFRKKIVITLLGSIASLISFIITILQS